MHDPHFFLGLQQLANKAFDLVERTLKTQPIVEKPVAVEVPTEPLDASSVPAAAAMGGTFSTLFQDPKEIVDPKKLEEFMRMLADVETEESDAGQPILGKISLARRTRSALSKAQIKKGNGSGSSDKLITSVWEQHLPVDADEPPVICLHL